MVCLQFYVQFQPQQHKLLLEPNPGHPQDENSCQVHSKKQKTKKQNEKPYRKNASFLKKIKIYICSNHQNSKIKHV